MEELVRCFILKSCQSQYHTWLRLANPPTKQRVFFYEVQIFVKFANKSLPHKNFLLEERKREILVNKNFLGQSCLANLAIAAGGYFFSVTKFGLAIITRYTVLQTADRGSQQCLPVNSCVQCCSRTKRYYCMHFLENGKKRDTKQDQIYYH